MQTKLLLDMISVETVDHRPVHAIFMSQFAYNEFKKLVDVPVLATDKYNKYMGQCEGIDIRLYTPPNRPEIQEYIDTFTMLNGNTPNIVLCN